MPLVHPLRELLGDPGARSFQLMGEDLVLIDGPALREAAARYESELARTVPADLQAARERELAGVLREAHVWLKKHNRSLYGRVRGDVARGVRCGFEYPGAGGALLRLCQVRGGGYVALGVRCGFEYPWPVVAILGICQVLGGVLRSRVYGVVGEIVGRAGIAALSELASGMDDVLLRTNRGIFADSVPVVLLALRAHALRRAGERALADALLAGPLPATMDDESRRLAAAVYEGLGVDGGEERFRVLSRVTLQHFAREQAIFSHHMGRGRRRPPRLVAALLESADVPAPRIVSVRGGRALKFVPYRLPDGFDIHDHDARVEQFGRAFVRSVTEDLDGYRVAVRYVVERFGQAGTPSRAAFLDGGSPTSEKAVGAPAR